MNDFDIIVVGGGHAGVDGDRGAGARQQHVVEPANEARRVLELWSGDEWRVG